MQLQSAKITLGSKEYTVQAAGFRRARGWKKAFLANLYDPLIANLAALNGINEQPLTLADLPSFTPLAQTLLLDTVETVCALLVSFSSVLEAAQDEIEETASDAQIVAAFVEVLKLASPLPPGLLANMNGLATMAMSANSPSLNGVSGLTKATA